MIPPALLLALAATQSSRPAALELKPDPSREPLPPLRTPVRVAARSVRIAYSGAVGAGPEVARSREEARLLAAAIAVRARSAEGAIAELAAQWSDDRETAREGGYRTLLPRKDASALEQALFRVRVGSVVGSLSTPGGFFVAQRVPLEEIAYEAVQIETLDEANRLAERVRREPALFDALDAQGFGPVPRGSLERTLEEALLRIAVGGIAGPVQTPSGLLLVRRAAVHWVTMDSILVAYRGARGAPLAQVRSREDAEERAAFLLERLRAGTDASTLARESDDPADRQRAGRRTFAVGPASGPPATDAARLEIGESRLAESPFGFHVVRRVALEVE
jgi:parvulin-like peptidyl-prolyl cis-trans isomerase-like protein